MTGQDLAVISKLPFNKYCYIVETLLTEKSLNYEENVEQLLLMIELSSPTYQQGILTFLMYKRIPNVFINEIISRLAIPKEKYKALAEEMIQFYVQNRLDADHVLTNLNTLMEKVPDIGDERMLSIACRQQPYCEALIYMLAKQRVDPTAAIYWANENRQYSLLSVLMREFDVSATFIEDVYQRVREQSFDDANKSKEISVNQPVWLTYLRHLFCVKIEKQCAQCNRDHKIVWSNIMRYCLCKDTPFTRRRSREAKNKFLQTQLVSIIEKEQFQNRVDPFTLENLQDIPYMLFVQVTEQEVKYAFDIGSLVQHLESNPRKTNPFTNLPLSDKSLETCHAKYEMLKKTVGLLDRGCNCLV